MIFYLFFFLIFLLSYYFFEKKRTWYFFILAIIPPALLEGLRDETVGTDMQGYITIWFNNMNPCLSALEIIKNARTPEYAYHLLMYFCKKISPDIHFFLTVCALIKISFVYFVANKFRRMINPFIFLLGYFCFFYVLGFSMMRQTIAVSICIYATTFLLTKDLVRFSLCIIMAYFFHNSAILMLAWFPIYFLRQYNFKYYIIFLSSVFLYFSIATLLANLVGSSLFKEDMAERYMNTGVDTSKTNLLISFSMLMYSIYLLAFNRRRRSNFLFLYVTSCILTIVFLLLASYMEVAFRLSYYMFIVSMLTTLIYIKNSGKMKGWLYFAYVFLFLLHFYISATHGLAGSLDYSSKNLMIRLS